MTTPRIPQGFGVFLIIILAASLVVTFIRMSLREPIVSATPRAVSATPAFVSHINDIYANPMTPAFGNPNGDVTIVQYFDYQCGYCKSDEENVERLVQEDKKVRIIYSDFVKLGPQSNVLATAVLASLRQGADKYLKLHQALLSSHASVTNDDALYATANAVGLDIEKLKEDMRDPAIARQIQEEHDIGKGVGVILTPTFIIGGYLVPGFQNYDQLKQMVAYIRSTNGKR